MSESKKSKWRPGREDPVFDELLERYPDLYDNVYCGFYPPSGWDDIIRELSAKLGTINKTLQDDEKIRCAQVKEKFSGLRYCFEGGTSVARDLVHAAISEAEKKSFVTCQWCGKPGKSSSSGRWARTLCTECKKTKENHPA